MGNCGQKTKTQLTPEEFRVGQALERVRPGLGEKLASTLVAASINNAEALAAASVEDLCKAGVSNEDAAAIHGACSDEAWAAHQQAISCCTAFSLSEGSAGRRSCSCSEGRSCS